MGWNSLDDMDLNGKRVLVRVDINVPMEEGRVTDDTRIQRIVPTIRDILAKGGHPILLAHFGRPKGKVVTDMSLQPLVPALEAAIGAPVMFCADCRGPAAEAAVGAQSDGQVVLLENTRFHAGEEKNDAALAAEMAKLGDVYCNDAFSAAHRAHASTEGLAREKSFLDVSQTDRAGRGAWHACAPGHGGCGWRKSIYQIGPSGQSGGQGRHAGDRRWHGQHLPGRPGR